MKVYTSVQDHSYSSEFPGERTEFPSVKAARAWFSDYINDRIYRWNGYESDFPCGGSEGAVMFVYLSQHSDEWLTHFTVGPKRYGDYTISGT